MLWNRATSTTTATNTIPNSQSDLTVTVVIQTLGFGGAATFWLDLLEELRSRGVTLNLYITSSEFSRQLLKRGFRINELPYIIDLIGNWKGLIKALFYLPMVFFQYFWLAWKERHSDVLIMSGFSEKIVLSPLAALFGIPVVWIEFAPLESVFNKFISLPRFLYNRVKQLPRQVITSSTYSYDWLVGAGGFSVDKVKQIQCGRAIQIKNYDPKSAQEVTGPLKQPAVVCVSRLEKGKGQDLLIETWSDVIETVPNAHLYIIGEGDFELELRAKVIKLDLKSAITLTDKVEDPLAYVTQAQVSVFPSMWPLEGFGLVTIEAMALGVPVVAFNRGPTTDVIQHQQNGLLARTGDRKDLAKQIIRLLTDHTLADTLATQAQHDFAARYTIQQVADLYLQTLQDVVKRKASS